MKGGARRSEVAPEEEEKKNPKNPRLVPPIYLACYRSIVLVFLSCNRYATIIKFY